MKLKHLLLLTVLLFTSLSFSNTTFANDSKNIIDANKYVAHNQELPDIELNGAMETYEFEKNKTVEMDSIFFTDLVSIETEEYSTLTGVIIAPLANHKTITMTYNSINFPPETTYTEYNTTYKMWYNGNLEFESSKKLSNGKYQATYSGGLIKQPN